MGRRGTDRRERRAESPRYGRVIEEEEGKGKTEEVKGGLKGLKWAMGKWADDRVGGCESGRMVEHGQIVVRMFDRMSG